MADLATLDVVEIDHPASGDLAVMFAVSPFPDDTIAAAPGYTIIRSRTIDGKTHAVAWKMLYDDGFLPTSTVLVGWTKAGPKTERLRFFRSRVAA